MIQQEVGAMASAQITEELLKQKALAIAQRVQEAGLPEQAGHLLHRMGRPMYEFLLLLATEEELRAAGMIPGPPPGAQNRSRPEARTDEPAPTQGGNGALARDDGGPPAARVVMRSAPTQGARTLSAPETASRSGTAPAPSAPPGRSSSAAEAATADSATAGRGWTERISPQAALERERQ
ncbi:MAG: hypothetical protein ACP5PW_03950, partial [Candidatus Dormibacteria bacterium]